MTPSNLCMVKTTATDTGHDWNDNGNGQNITDTATNSNLVTVMDSKTVTDTDMVTRAGTLIDNHWHDQEHGNRHGHVRLLTLGYGPDMDMDTETETVMDTRHGHKLGHGQGHWSLITRSLVTRSLTSGKQQWKHFFVTDTIELGHGHIHRNNHGHCH